jgi:hypothetical protein
MTKLSALGRSVSWGVCAVGFGLLPVWMSLILPEINGEITFSEIELLKSGALIIFAIILTISVLVDYYLSRFKYSSRTVALWFNVFFPFAICICGMLFHVATIWTKSEVLNTRLVLSTIFAVLYCIIQKVLFVYEDEGSRHHDAVSFVACGCCSVVPHRPSCVRRGSGDHQAKAALYYGRAQQKARGKHTRCREECGDAHLLSDWRRLLWKK